MSHSSKPAPTLSAIGQSRKVVTMHAQRSVGTHPSSKSLTDPHNEDDSMNETRNQSGFGRDVQAPGANGPPLADAGGIEMGWS
jgi:hypothetical protein